MHLKIGNCIICNNVFKSYNKNPRFCSHKCWYNYRKINKVPSGAKEDYDKRSNTLKKWYKENPDIVKRKCQKQSKTLIKTIEDRGGVWFSSFRGDRTKTEKIIDEILNDLNIKNMPNYIFCGMKRAPCIVDSYLPNKNICIEIDGKSHSNEKQIKKDILKEEFLRSKNIRIIRLTDNFILNSNNEEVIERVQTLLNQ